MKKIPRIKMATDHPLQIKTILGKPYARRLIPDESGGFVASIHEFPGCVADGDTPEEALHNLDKAAASWLEAALSSGYEVRDPVSYFGYSGKIALRIPRGLHKQVAELAEYEDCSVNQVLVTAIAEYVAGKHAYRQLSESLFSEMRRIVADGLISFRKNGPASVLIAFSTGASIQNIVGTTIEGQTSEKIFDLQKRFPHHNQLVVGGV